MYVVIVLTLYSKAWQVLLLDVVRHVVREVQGAIAVAVPPLTAVAHLALASPGITEQVVYETPFCIKNN